MSMTSETISSGPKPSEQVVQALANDGWRYLWFVIGAVLWLFALGGRWDLPLAAWLFSVFLLRFSRASRPVVGISLVWLASVAAALFWLWQLAVPIQVSSVVGSLAYGTLFAVPFLLDRLLAPRLGAASAMLLFPAALAACEFLAGAFSPLGAAYGMRAVAQHDNLALLQIIAVTGPYAIGFLVGWFATVANQV